MSTNQTAPLVRDELQANYDGYYADGKSEWRELGAKYKVENIVSMCSPIPHANVLDIGAGEGAVSAELSRRAFSSDIKCVEISESGVGVIENRQIDNVTEVKRFDGYHIPYPDGHFDLAIATHVLEHVEHERQFIYEASRVGKYLFVEVPLEDTLRLPLDYEPSSLGHINFYNFKTVRRLLQSSGLEILDARLFDTPLDVLTFHGKLTGTGKFVVRRIAALLNRRLAAEYFTYHCAILCRRST